MPGRQVAVETYVLVSDSSTSALRVEVYCSFRVGSALLMPSRVSQGLNCKQQRKGTCGGGEVVIVCKFQLILMQQNHQKSAAAACCTIRVHMHSTRHLV
jgi:hypothetical protein